MKLEALKEKLGLAITKANSLTGKNTANPILKCLLLETKDNALLIKATNLDLGVEILVPVKVEVEGSVAVSGQTLNSFLSGLDKDKNILLEVKETQLTATSSKTASSFKLYPTEEYPLIPRITAPKTFTIKAKDFVRGLRSVAYSAAVTSMKPELSSVFIYPEDNVLVFVATDSFRLAEKRIVTKEHFDFEQILIPFRNVGEIVRVLDEYDGEMTVSFDKNQVSFEIDSVYMVSRVVDGVFPAYKNIIPKETKTEATLLKNDFVNSLKLSHVFSDSFNRITFLVNPSEKTLEIKSKNSEIGENSTKVSGSFTGEPVEISFNYKNIYDCFQSIDSDSVTLSFAGLNRPLTIRGGNDTGFFYLAMPMNK